MTRDRREGRHYGQRVRLLYSGFSFSSSGESRILESMQEEPPGPFTVILAGKSGGVGIGLIEIYNVK
jgi:hypothetical protein